MEIRKRPDTTRFVRGPAIGCNHEDRQLPAPRLPELLRDDFAIVWREPHIKQHQRRASYSGPLERLAPAAGRRYREPLGTLRVLEGLLQALAGRGKEPAVGRAAQPPLLGDAIE